VSSAPRTDGGTCEAAGRADNNLDIASVEQLAQALDAYRGALLVASHDFDFLERLGVDTVLELDSDGHLHQVPELRLSGTS
jgi:ATPase subunit of ABC transporter with duplicated ATPase domains